MRIVATLVGLAAVAAALALPATAEASPPRVQAYDCHALAAKLGPAKVWQTSFWGYRKDLFGFKQQLLASPCFANETNCKAWLYWAQSDWPDHVAPRRCRQGIPY